MDKISLNKRNWKIDRPVKSNSGGYIYVIGITGSGAIIWSDGSIEDSISYYSNLYEYSLLRDSIRRNQENEQTCVCG